MLTYRYYFRVCLNSILTAIALISIAGANGPSIPYDLGAQWNSVANPSRPWSYNQDGSPLPFHQTNWSSLPGLNGWTTTSVGVTPPGWFLVTDAAAFPTTADVGDVTVHSSSGNDPLADVTWTSCAAGFIDISGQAWDVEHFACRDDEWSLLVGGTLIASRDTILGVAKDSVEASFATNVLAGESLTGISVAAGDVVTLRVRKSDIGPFGHFTGIDLSIVLSPAGDTDDDGIGDAQDNCVAISNVDQLDSNSDGIGNACDPDIGGPAGAGFDDGQVNFADLNIFKDSFFSNSSSANWNPDADFTGDDQVNFADLQVMEMFFFGSPGPSCVPATRR